MININYLLNHIEIVKDNIKKRNVTNSNPDLAVELYKKKNDLQRKIDELRQARNKVADRMKEKLDADVRISLINQGKDLKEIISDFENQITSITQQFDTELKRIPNLTHPDVPVGKENEGKIILRVGKPPLFNFEIKDHIILAQDHDLIDFENASNISGSKFYFLKNEAALLELALINFSVQKLIKAGFTPYITPDLARASILEGIGFNPRGEETQVYSVANSDLCLIGTAEIPLGGLLNNKIIRKSELPMLLVGYSHCFRTEAGAAGMATKGLYRVHQFSKVEMFVYCSAEDSEIMHEKLKNIEIEIYQELGLCFRVVDIPTMDLGNPAYRKFDLEAWFPSKNDYGEITSTSNCTDYQSRSLNMRYKDTDGKIEFLHTLNGTACAVPRVLIAILENYQQEDGSVLIPEILQPYMMGQKVIKKKIHDER